MQIIDDLLSLPVRGLMGIYKLPHDASEADYLNRQLRELEILWKLGEISTVGYEERAAELHGRLDKALGLAA